MSVIKGESAILYWRVNGIYAPVACMESCNVTTNSELSETSTIQSGIYRTYRGKRQTWTVSCRGLVSFDQNHPHVKLRQLQQSFTPVPISFSATDENGITYTFSGTVLITSMPDDAAANDFYTYAIEATGTGEYVITDIPVDPNECCQDAWVYYTGTGAEGNVIQLDSLIGKSIAGRLYRDGIEYRPSGINQDGTGAPIGKQFKFEPATGTITFDPDIGAIANGEPIDIPWNSCGSLTGCQIIIRNVEAQPDPDDDDKFHITFIPEIGNVITAPDDVRVRYSTDNGATWTIPNSITYDPNVNYALVVINDALSLDQSYLFEITPICDGAMGSSGTGYYVACVPVSITPKTLADAQVNIPYDEFVVLNGTIPFGITNIVKPDWATVQVVGSRVTITGTPTETDTGVEISFTVTNCIDKSADFSTTIDVLVNPTNTEVINQLPVAMIQDVIFDGSPCTPYENFPVPTSDTGRATIPLSIMSQITVRFNIVPAGPLRLEITINSIVQETVTIAVPTTVVITSANSYNLSISDDVVLRLY